jgi:hypothetical protein
MMQEVDRDEVPPWEQLGAVRRDCEPHRAGLVLWLGMFGIVSGAASLLFFFPLLVGLPLGLAAWWMGRRDLAKMRKGLMDPSGEGDTWWGTRQGRRGVILSLLGILLSIAVLVAVLVGGLPPKLADIKRLWERPSRPPLDINDPAPTLKPRP